MNPSVDRYKSAHFRNIDASGGDVTFKNRNAQESSFHNNAYLGEDQNQMTSKDEGLNHLEINTLWHKERNLTPENLPVTCRLLIHLSVHNRNT